MFGKKKKTFWENIKGLFEGFNKVSDIVDRTEEKVMKTINNAERVVYSKLRKIKKMLFRSVLQIIFVGIGAVFLVLGIVLFLARFWPIEYILIIIGLFLMYVAFLFNWMR